MSVFAADVYEAVFDDSALVAVCEKISAANPRGALIMQYVDHETRRRTVIHCVGLDDHRRMALERDTQMLDLGTTDITAMERLALHSNLDFLERDALAASPAWVNQVGGLGIECVDNYCLRKGGTFTAFLSLAYPREEERAVRQTTLQVLQQIGPHLAHAMELRGRRFQDIDAQCSALMGRVRSPVVLLDMDGRLVRCNEAAKGYLTSRDGTDGGEPENLGTSQRLDDLLKALPPLPDGPQDTFYRDCDGNHVLASVTDYPFPAAPLLRAQWAQEYLAYPAALVSLKVAHETQCDIPEELLGSFKLSPAERRLLEGILTGMSLSEIADTRSVSYNTLKNQLRSVNEKTGIHRQTNLVRIFSSLSN